MQKVFDLIVERLEECTIKSKDSLAFFNECGVKFVSTNKAIEIVNQTAEEYKSNDGWIPCSSGVMPKYGDNVLVSLNYAFLPLIATLYEDNTWKMLQGINGLIDITGKVIAWRELPQPYQPKGE